MLADGVPGGGGRPARGDGVGGGEDWPPPPLPPGPALPPLSPPLAGGLQLLQAHSSRPRWRQRFWLV